MIYFLRNSADNSLILWNTGSKIHEISVIIWKFCEVAKLMKLSVCWFQMLAGSQSDGKSRPQVGTSTMGGAIWQYSLLNMCTSRFQESGGFYTRAIQRVRQFGGFYRTDLKVYLCSQKTPPHPPQILLQFMVPEFKSLWVTRQREASFKGF